MVFCASQHVCAFLPVAHYGLSFLVNADFDVSSSRESIDEKRKWNQYLLSHLPALFVNAVHAVILSVVDQARQRAHLRRAQEQADAEVAAHVAVMAAADGGDSDDDVDDVFGSPTGPSKQQSRRAKKKPGQKPSPRRAPAASVGTAAGGGRGVLAAGDVEQVVHADHESDASTMPVDDKGMDQLVYLFALLPTAGRAKAPFKALPVAVRNLLHPLQCVPIEGGGFVRPCHALLWPSSLEKYNTGDEDTDGECR